MSDLNGIWKISVIIPTWNRAHSLEQTILSALAQTYPPFEVLICDDGSTDDSEEVVRNIGDHRVHWVAGDHSGCPATPRNRGIAISRGDLIAFLDSDDIWLPEKLQLQVAVIEQSGSLAVCTNAYRDFGQELPEYLLNWNRDYLTFSQLLMGNKVICSSVLVWRSIFQRAGGFPESKKFKAIEDYALWLKIARLQDLSYISSPLVVYKDDPMHSVRSEDFSVITQRKRVFGEYLKWQFSRNILYGLFDVIRITFIFLWLLLRDILHLLFSKIKTIYVF